MTDAKDETTTWSGADQPEMPVRPMRPHLRVVTKAALLGAIFLIVPVLLYAQFLSADRDKRALVTASVREQGHTVAAALTPILTQPGPATCPRSGASSRASPIR